MSTNILSDVFAIAAAGMAAFIGAWASNRFGSKQRQLTHRDERRHRAAEEILATMLPLRTMLLEGEQEEPVALWRRRIIDVYEALDDARPVLPDRLGHVKRSVRGALGEALGGGLSFSDLRAHFESDARQPYDDRWGPYAFEYVDIVVATVRKWRDADRAQASRVGCLNYDEWLAKTGRYEPFR